MAEKQGADLTVGEYIRQQVLPAGMSVKEAANRLGVGRPALSNVLNGNAALSPDMAVRLEKSFGADRQKLLDMQSAAGRAKHRDPVVRHGWLFEKQWVEESADELEEDDTDFTAREERIHALRMKALAEVWSERGFDGVAALLADSGAAPTVGQYAALCITDSARRIDFLLRCLELGGDLEQKAEGCILGFLWSVDSGARQALLRAVADKVGADQRVRLFKSSPFEKLTWLTVDQYSAESSTRYWKEVSPQWSRRHSDSDLNELVDHLLNADRPRAAFHAAHMDWARLETSRLKRLLTDVATIGAEPQDTPSP